MSTEKQTYGVTHQTETDQSWDVVRNGEVIATCGKSFDEQSQPAEHARSIVAALNSHEALVAACKALWEKFEAGSLCLEDFDEAKAALAQAEVEV